MFIRAHRNEPNVIAMILENTRILYMKKCENMTFSEKTSK